jgi:hypothetical protein
MLKKGEMGFYYNRAKNRVGFLSFMINKSSLKVLIGFAISISGCIFVSPWFLPELPDYPAFYLQ